MRLFDCYPTLSDDMIIIRKMTQDDINNGNLIIQVGIAAVRPAEFIILEFSHKVQQ